MIGYFGGFLIYLISKLLSVDANFSMFLGLMAALWINTNEIKHELKKQRWKK